MPPSKDQGSKYSYSRSFSNNDMGLNAKVYHPATNLLPPSVPSSPTGVAPGWPSSRSTPGGFSRQNSSKSKGSTWQ